MPTSISKHYTGKSQAMADTRTGEFWHAIPPLDNDDRRIQKMLFKPAAPDVYQRVLALSRVHLKVPVAA